jgi:Domain of unknown function (DUF5916)/Carbohydrate family 9 binding domain-like
MILLSRSSPASAAQAPGAAAPPEPTPVFTIPRSSTPIRIDGVLDEEAWKGALRLDLPYEIEPGENTPAPVKTEVLLTYDDAGLHAAFRAYDPDPAEIRAHLSDRDQALRDDWVALFLDTFNDERRGFELFVNPYGVQMDASRNDVGNGGDQSEDMTWDAIWLSAGRITQQGYDVEMSIPFTSLRFSRASEDLTWGLSVMRNYPRNLRHQISLRPIDRNRDCFFCQEAKVAGLNGIAPGRNLELDPTLTAHRTDEREEVQGAPLEIGRPAGEGGLSARWSVTPNLTFNTALNPDFSQVEADTAQLGINQRFALFYPEKRPFFMESADFFTTPLNVVYTRTVQEPRWGVKLSGKEGPHAIGAAFGRDEKTYLLFPSNQESDDTTLNEVNDVGVLRYRHDVGKNSTLGLLMTNREGVDYRNRMYGLDGLLRLGPADTVRFQGLRSDTRYPAAVSAEFDQPVGAFGDEALVLRYVHASRNWFWLGNYEDLGRNFRADTGFLPRVDTRKAEWITEHTTWGRPESFYTRLIFGVWGYRTLDHDGELTDSDIGLHGLVFGPLQSFLFTRVAAQKEFFDGTTYDKTIGEFFFNMRPSGALTFSLGGKFGDAVDYDNDRPGRLFRVVPGLTLDLGRHFHTQIDETFERLNVAGGRLYTANLTQLRLIYQFSVRTFGRAIVQYTDIDRDVSLYDPVLNPDGVQAHERELLTQLLYSYKINPQTLIYAGYSDNRTTEDFVDLTQRDRTLFIKVGYAWVM